MKTKSFGDFIRENRAALDESISRVRNIGRERNPIQAAPLNDSDRRCWVLNEPALYAWAQSEGVRI